MLLSTLVQGLTSFALTQTLSKAAQRLIAELRSQVQEHVGRLPLKYFDSTKVGTLVSRIMTDVEGVRNLIGTGLIDFAGGLLTAVIAFVVLVRISPVMTAIAFGFLLVFGRGAAQGLPNHPAHLPRARQDQCRGHRTPHRVAGRSARRQGLPRRGTRARGLRHRHRPSSAERLPHSHRNLAAGTLLGHADGRGRSHRHVHGLARRSWPASSPSADISPTSCFSDISPRRSSRWSASEPSSPRRWPDWSAPARCSTSIPKTKTRKRTLSLGRIDGEVEFRDVTFGYTPDKPVLHDVSFEAMPGTLTALVGSSGSGKSTIISLLAAFHTPQTGQVLVDGADLSTVRLESYRSQLGVVLQDSFLFDGTISRKRRLLASPCQPRSRSSRPAASRASMSSPKALPHGYDTIIGERGVKLSGGQRQRLSIARAILADPRILILDEATSSLDSESEAIIQSGLAYLMRGRTTFVIAHRLSTIRRADQILVVEAGRIVERGTHAKLLLHEGRYYDLYTRQHGLEENLFLAPGEGDPR